jgi:acetolactate synthase-1/2/3 large subunit
VAADWVIVDFFAQADLLLGIGFDPVESDKLWHHTMKIASLAPVSIAAGEYRPYLEVVGDVNQSLAALTRDSWGPFDWTDGAFAAYRQRMQDTLRSHHILRSGVSPYDATRCLRELFPRDTILATDVGAVKFVTSQAWTTFEPLTFLQSNGLSAMSYGFGAAMAAKLLFPERPVLCTIGDGGFGMTLADVETCVRSGIHFVTVVYNDGGLSLIRVVQQRKGHQACGVDYGPVDFAAICAGLGAWTRRVESMDDLRLAIAEALQVNRPVVLDLCVDPTEYRAHIAPVVAESQP